MSENKLLLIHTTVIVIYQLAHENVIYFINFLNLISNFLQFPDAFNNDLILQTLRDILAGKKCEIPVYDYRTNSRYVYNWLCVANKRSESTKD